MGYNSQDSIFVGELPDSDTLKDYSVLASASADYRKIKNGILSYLNIGVDAGKLVLGVPWYRTVIVLLSTGLTSANRLYAIRQSYVYPCLFNFIDNKGSIPPCFVNFPVRSNYTCIGI